MKTKLKISAGSYNRSVSRNHYTTMGFGELFPVYSEEVYPNDNVTIRPELFGRSQPSIVPTLTRLSVCQRAFYVPFSSVWRHWNNYINGLPCDFKTGGSGTTTKQFVKQVPYFTNKQLTNVFIDNSDSGGLTILVSHEDVQNGSPFDIALPISDDSSFVYYKLTILGKRFLKVLQSLGYNFNFIGVSAPGTLVETYSALPLFCYYKIIYDRYLPSTLRVNSFLDDVFQRFNNLVASNQGLIIVPETLLTQLALLPQLYYDNNYFTSQWTSLNEPVPNYISSMNNRVSEGQLNQSGLHTNDIEANTSDVHIAGDLPTTATRNIMMSSLRKMVMRMGLTGSRAIDRFFTTFGVHIPELELSMCKYCGSIDAPIQMMDVVSQGDVDSLGELGGKSWVASSDGEFRISCDQHGFVIVLASVDVPSQFVSGVRRRVLHKFPHDFYTPDFDDSTLQATAGSELLGQLTYDLGNIRDNLIYYHLSPNAIFGFTARYDELRKPIDDITGDFTIPSLNTTIDGYVNPRKLLDNLKLQNTIEYNAVAHPADPGLDFNISNVATGDIFVDDTITANPVTVQSQNDAQQFNRIYKDLDGRADPLRCHYKFNVSINGCVKPSDIALFVDGNGREIEIEKNGNKFD